MMDWVFWWPVILGGIIAGGSCGLIGVYIVGMRIPFLAVCISHAALAGAVFGSLFGLSQHQLLFPALGAAIIAALSLGYMEERSERVDANVLIGLLFSLSMGLAFLGIGLFPMTGRSANEVLSLLWGNLYFCQPTDVTLMSVIAIVLTLFLFVFRKEMQAILFSRLHAAAAGIAVGTIWTAFLILTSVSLTVNFQIVGGLMIYSLVTNPAIAAFQLTRGHTKVSILAAIMGAGTGLFGFLLAYFFDLPTGATIVILSSLLVAVAFVIGRFRRA